MPSANGPIRRWLGYAVVAVVLVGVSGWLLNRSYTASRRHEAERQADAELVRHARCQDLLQDLELIGNAGDEKTRARCSHAIHLLAAMEPEWYKMYRTYRAAPAWLADPPPEGG